MAKHDLQIAHKGATMQGVGCERMAQAMRRKTFQVAPVGCLFDGPLDVVFMATPPHLCCAARIATGGA